MIDGSGGPRRPRINFAPKSALLVPRGDLGPESDTWSQKLPPGLLNALLDPKTHFGAQNAFLGPRCISGSKMLPGEKGPKRNRLFRTAVVKNDVSKE